MRGTVLSLVAFLSFALSGCGNGPSTDEGLDFSRLDLSVDVENELPALKPFEARDGARLQYRHYSSGSDTALILLHGSATESSYLYPLAEALAASGVADVYTPDLRGHGPSPVRRGDIDYVEQLEDDLADLIEHIKATDNEVQGILVAGHSSGGGLAVRFAGGEHGHLASGYVLLAPYLGHDAPTVRQDSGGWANPRLSRIIPISMLNGLGITAFNGSRVLYFNIPPEYQNDSVTLSYSYRLMTGINPSDFERDFDAIEVPLLVIVGTEDEALVASQFEPTLKPVAPHASIRVVDDVSHLGVISDPKGEKIIIRWLKDL